MSMTSRQFEISKLTESFEKLAVEARELYLDTRVPEIDVPSSLEFLRKYVSTNKPVLIQNGLAHWKALKAWNPEYFRKKIGDLEVTVTVTPNGYADAVTDGRFVMPEERTIKMEDFLDILQEPDKHPGVFYIQKQNSNLTDEFQEIIDDVDMEIRWGSEAFGKSPDAVNFWMGDERAITSMHRDHYENLYCVVRGWKEFILIPPTDLPFVPYETYEPAVFKQNCQGEFQIVDAENTGKVPWVAIDPLNPDLKKYPNYAKARPMTVRVHEGEILYLPSLWLHHVSQSHGCIAVNYWYDMEFDIKYNYYKFMEHIAEIAR